MKVKSIYWIALAACLAIAIVDGLRIRDKASIVAGKYEEALTQERINGEALTLKTVRGILCQNCNLALGLIHDNAKTGRSMIAYLERWGKTTEEIA